MVAMSGAIMPAPLAMPLIVTSTPPSRAVRVATFGKVSVVMIALRGVEPAVSARALLAGAEHALELRGIERLADDAGRGEEDLAPARQPAARAAISAVSRDGRRRRFWPVKALALPELTTSARARCRRRGSCGTNRPAPTGSSSG